MNIEDLPKVTKGIDANADRHRYYVGHRPVHRNVVGIEVFKGSEIGRFVTEAQAKEYMDLRSEIVELKQALSGSAVSCCACNAMAEENIQDEEGSYKHSGRP